MFVVRCLWCVVCLPFVICCLRCALWCVLWAVRCWRRVACCLLFGVLFVDCGVLCVVRRLLLCVV